MFLLRKLSGRSGLSTTQRGNPNISSQDVSEQALDQASQYINEGDYEEALWILERLGQLDPSVKGVAELAAVAEVCNAAVLSSCACMSRNTNPDWYKVLKVEEKSEPSVIKKRYRHLALLLHPDKNKHAKAESAFKLVSEAYACLADKKKRANFNLRRSFAKCKNCTVRDCASSGSDRWSGHHVLSESSSLRRPGSSPDLTQTDWVLDQERLNIFRARARARVFGNLEKAWKERGFTELQRSRLVKEDLHKHSKGRVRTDHCQHGGRKRAGESNQKKEENSTDCFTVTGHEDSEAKISMVDAKQNEFNHQQLFQPCKNLGLLIRDLQAELVSSMEDRGYQTDEQDDAYQKYTPENAMRPDARIPESCLVEGHRMSDHMSNPHQADFMEQFPATSKAVLHNQANRTGEETSSTAGIYCASPHGQKYPVRLFDHDSSTPKPRADKEWLHRHRAEHDSSWENVAEVHSQPVQRSEGTDYTDTVSKKQGLCRQARKNDSLDLEETLLRAQKEKSEELLKTLERLREETRTVAASLNHFCSGGSS